MSLPPLKKPLSRRNFLKLGLAMTTLAACSPLPNLVSTAVAAQNNPSPSPTSTPAPGAGTPSPSLKLGFSTYSPQTWLAAGRLTFGPIPAELDWIEKNGVDAFIEEQLAYEQIDDSALQPRLAAFPTLTQDAVHIFQDNRPDVLSDLQAAALIRAVYSRRQLYELAVDFWTNHFNIDFNKGQDRYLKTVDDREVIRKYAFASFRELLGATAHSPAMILSLDNNTNLKGHPNENYARELMELHTISVNGGYTQQDVSEVARAFTGWTVYGPGGNNNAAGTFRFALPQHDQGAKTVLNQAIPANGGMMDGEQVLDLLASHPNCAHFICTKLARRFISDNPPESAVQAGVAAFQKSKGDLRATLGAVLHSPEFKNSSAQKIRRPLEFAAAALRALQAEVGDARQLLALISEMGQPLFLWPAPNGFPDMAGAWINSGVLLVRWNFALALAGNHINGIQVDLKAAGPQSTDVVNGWCKQLLSVALPPDALAALQPFSTPNLLPELVALLLSSPQYQFRG